MVSVKKNRREEKKSQHPTIVEIKTAADSKEDPSPRFTRSPVWSHPS